MTAPVFIIGSPRSGTTVVAWALGQHVDFWTGGEFHLFSRLFAHGRIEDLLEKELSFPGALRRGEVTREQFLEAFGSGFDSMFSRLSAGRRWVDQTPSNTFIADTLAAMFPTAQFVHLLRDGRQVVNSMIHFADAHSPERRSELQKLGYFPPWATNFEAACREWSQSVEAAETFRNRHEDRCYLARHERLASDAESFWSDLLGFLGSAPDPALVRYVKLNRINSSFTQPTDGASAVTRWTTDQQRTFDRVAAQMADRHALSVTVGNSDIEHGQ